MASQQPEQSAEVLGILRGAEARRHTRARSITDSTSEGEAAAMPKPVSPSRPPSIRSISKIPLLRECGGHGVDYLIEPVLPVGAVTAITGDSGSGKSTLVSAWGGKVAHDGRPVLVLDRENPISVVLDRFERLGISDGPLLHYWGGWLSDEAPQPAAGVVLTWVVSCDPRPLVIIDSLVAFHGGDENDASAMRGFMHQCRKLADLGATVVVIHHDGKGESSKDFRGSSDFKAAVDVAFHVSNSSEDGRLSTLRLRCYKSRFGFAGELIYRYADGQFLRDEDQNAAKRSVTEQLTELLRGNPGIDATSFEKLAVDRKLPRSRARQFLNDGLLAETIRRETGGRNTKRHFLVEDKKP